MPSNVIIINGADDLTFNISDSFMPVLMKWIEYATKTPEEGTQRDSMMGNMVNAMIQERYGPDMEWTNFRVSNCLEGQQYITEVEMAEVEKMRPETSLDQDSEDESGPRKIDAPEGFLHRNT